MIFGNISQEKRYTYLEKNILRCFSYMKENDLSAFDKGSYEINGQQLFVNVVEYETTTAENRFWEAHRYYLDLHVMLSGQEQIDLNFIENMTQGEFVEKDDFLPLEGERSSCVTMRKGDFLLCCPDDAHRTAVQVEQSEKIKKAIFKIKIE